MPGLRQLIRAPRCPQAIAAACARSAVGALVEDVGHAGVPDLFGGERGVGGQLVGAGVRQGVLEVGREPGAHVAGHAGDHDAGPAGRDDAGELVENVGGAEQVDGALARSLVADRGVRGGVPLPVTVERPRPSWEGEQGTPSYDQFILLDQIDDIDKAHAGADAVLVRGRQVQIADSADPNFAHYWIDTTDLAQWIATRGYSH